MTICQQKNSTLFSQPVDCFISLFILLGKYPPLSKTLTEKSPDDVLLLNNTNPCFGKFSYGKLQPAFSYYAVPNLGLLITSVNFSTMACGFSDYKSSYVFFSIYLQISSIFQNCVSTVRSLINMELGIHGNLYIFPSVFHCFHDIKAATSSRNYMF